MLEGYKDMSRWLLEFMGITREPGTIRQWAAKYGLAVQHARRRVYISEDVLRAFVMARSSTPATQRRTASITDDGEHVDSNGR